MGQRQLVKAFLFCSVAIGALLASPLIARADITLYEKDGFSFFTSGRSAAHYQFIYGQGTPAPAVMGGSLTGFTTDAATNDSNKIATSRIRSGWVGAQLNFGLIAPITPEVKSKTYFSFNVDDITNDRQMTAEEVVFCANDRCDQENLIAQLKSGVRALSTPVDDLVSNWAYMVMGSLAWSLKAWSALLVPVSPRHRAKHEAEKRTLLRMEFSTYCAAFIQMPCQIVRSGRRLIYRLLSWNPWQGVFLRLVERPKAGRLRFAVGIHHASRAPVRAGTRGKRLVAPRASQVDPVHLSSCAADIWIPPSTKTSPVPTVPVTPSTPNPSRTPAETAPAPLMPVSPRPPQAAAPSIEAKPPRKGPISSRNRGRFTLPSARPGTGVDSSLLDIATAIPSRPWSVGCRSSLHASNANIAAGPGPNERAEAAT